MLLFIVEGQKEECLLVQELSLKNFRRVDLFSAFVLKVR